MTGRNIHLISLFLILGLPLLASGANPKIHDVRLDYFFGGPVAMVASEYQVHGELTFIGSGSLNSLYLHYQVNGEEVQTTFFDEIGLNPMIPFYYQAHNPWLPESDGTHQLKVWFSGLNGAPVEEGASDTLLLDVGVYEHLPARELTLLESFSSMNCGSCALLNPQLRDMVDEHEEIYAMIFYHPFGHENSPIYQLNDKDNDIRRAFYQVTYSPFAVIGSVHQGSAEYVSHDRMQLKHNRPAGFAIDAIYTVVDDLMHVQVEVESFVDMPAANLRLMVSVTQDHIGFDVPPGSNGEQDFYHVMRSFLPDANGSYLPPQFAGDIYHIDLYYYLGNAELTEEDIEVLAFVQDMDTFAIFQTSRVAYQESDGDDEDDDGNGDDNGDGDNGDGDGDNGDDEGGDGDETSVNESDPGRRFSVYPNPGEGLFTLRLPDDLTPDAIRIYDATGRMLHSPDHAPYTSSGEIQLDLRHLGPGIYFLQMLTGQGPLHKTIIFTSR